MDEPDFLDEDVISKSQLKREAHAQQDLGERLTRLSEDALEALPLGDRLHTAILEFKRLPPKHGALKRQLQFIGKLMRGSDIDAILAIINGQPTQQKPQQAPKKEAEIQLQLILESGDEGIQTVLQQLPKLDRQKARQLLRSAKSTSDEAKQAAGQQRLLDYLLQLNRG